MTNIIWPLKKYQQMSKHFFQLLYFSFVNWAKQFYVFLVCLNLNNNLTVCNVSELMKFLSILVAILQTWVISLMIWITTVLTLQTPVPSLIMSSFGKVMISRHINNAKQLLSVPFLPINNTLFLLLPFYVNFNKAVAYILSSQLYPKP